MHPSVQLFKSSLFDRAATFSLCVDELFPVIVNVVIVMVFVVGLVKVADGVIASTH